MSTASSAEYWGKKTFVLITGASRGIGRTLTEKLAGLLAPGSLLLLMSRGEKGLTSLKAHIQDHHQGILVHLGIVDLSNCHESVLTEVVSTALSDHHLKPSDFDHSICVHNAGSLGDASKRCTDILEFGPCMDYFRLNIGHVMVLNAIFMKVFAGVRKTVVNITSLCGIEPFPSLSLYCVGKAGRQMFFKVLAKEEPETRVLNYSPGPVATSMQDQLVEQTWNAEMKASVSSAALTTDMTCGRLIELLSQDKYSSGSNVDYFDPPLE